MSGGFDLGDDDQLIELLDDALDDAEPLPLHLQEYARGIFDLASLERVLAELTYDSSAMGELQGVRGEGDRRDRMLVYASGALSIELLITAGDELRGQLVPPQRCSVVLLATSGAEPLMADADGSFRFQLPSGEFRILVELDDTRVQTPPIPH